MNAPADLGTEVIGVPEGSDLDLDLRLESVMEGVLVSGTATGTAVGECVRCLEAVEQDLFVDLQELFVYPGRAHEEDEDDLREIEDDLIDLEPALRDAVVLALPFQPVCAEDCPGLCSECGVRLAEDPGHQHVDVDPRWAALQGLTGQAGGSTKDGQEHLPHDEKES
ncbi:MAG: YceD family protein [Kineosporiaceae bacterium]